MPLKTKKIIILALVSAVLVFCVSARAEDASFTGVVNSDNINVRADSTVTSAVICALDKSSKVEVVSELYGWYKIRLPDSAPSYIKKDFLEYNPKSVSAKITHNHVNIRSGPGESYWIVGILDRDRLVNILGEDQGWCRIMPVHDSYAWINKKFITPDDSPDGKTSSAADNLLVLEGIIRPYGVVLWRTATHKLLTQEEGAYLLKGDKKGLDALIGSKVRISGKLIGPASSANPVIDVFKIEAVD